MAGAEFGERARADACPGALQTHPAADGAVARVRVPGGLLTGDQLGELGAACAALGSGVVELTSRANVQVRGLDGPGAGRFAEKMAAIGLLPSATHERVRNILASPMAGLDGRGLVEVARLVRELDESLTSRPALAELPGRFLFALDDGRGDVARLAADVAYLPAAPRTPPVTPLATAGPEPMGAPASAGSEPVEGALLLAGRDTGLRAGPAEVVPLMIAAAEAFLAERAAQGSAAWRVAELTDGPAKIVARMPAAGSGAVRIGALGSEGTRAPAPPPFHDQAGRPPSAEGGNPLVPDRTTPSLGPVAQTDGRVALVVMPPLGRLTAAQASELAEAARAGAGEVRLTPWRTVIVPGMARDTAESWLARLGEAGLVTDPASPWTGVTSCTGRPGCAKSLSDVQSDATHATMGAVPCPGGDLSRERPRLPVHWVGCERACGRPSGPAVLVVATGDGYRVESGEAGARHLDIEETAVAVATARAANDAH
ncbi:precorrin-3B synthase [Sphaerisporangium album]|uniref:Precorrin-3B synthase n=1 Tax=Sphaerisporangium album TaxID=509200 RepID=A0A367EYT3_9ACTN|nr:precorrin-3B synthase [Sphaerisporangium album]RCG22782.1 precorrin-3B synthase [Sphaerisporangium album]